MRQEQERFRSFDLGVDTNAPRVWNPIDTSVTRLPIEAIRQERVRGVSFSTNQEDNKEEGSQKENGQKSDGFDPAKRGFEPFINPEPQEGNLLENIYRGNFSQKMELNRQRAERVLKIAHLNGKVVLSSLPQSRSRSEVQGNELAAKRFLIFDRKTQKPEEENPYKRVVSTPEGWRIEINDQRITEELSEQQKLSGEKLQKAFVNNFNMQLKDGIRDCVWREKLSSEKDRLFIANFISSILTPAVLFSFDALILGINVRNSEFNIAWTLFTYKLVNIFESGLPNRRKINFLESFLPPVEIDKVGRTFAYLSGKGRTLVREATP